MLILIATLATTEVSAGAVAKADQKNFIIIIPGEWKMDYSTEIENWNYLMLFTI